ncbi:MAG: AMP-binding protein [Candidatus Zeuxoniibacter abyssi]|nr:MAG: AMP-binding protein [Candidatus Persebacteraceae bacterium AB1(2)]
MTAVHWLLKRITAFGDKTAVISETRRHSYRESSDLVFSWDKKFAKAGINAGAVTAVCGDYSADTIAALIALLGWRTIVVPITQMPIAEMEKRFKIASCDFVVTPKRDDICVFTKSSKDPLTQSLIKAGKAGLILFSSGTTGEPKGMVRDLNLMVESYKNKKATDTVLLMFLLFDHIGGIDTFFGALARGNRLVICKPRDAVTVAALIEKHGINVFSTSATFLALMSIADVFDKFNLGCLRRIAYGTEPMPQHLLYKLRKNFRGRGLFKLSAPVKPEFSNHESLIR